MTHPAPPDDDALLWQQAVAGVQALPPSDRVLPVPLRPPPRRHRADAALALGPALSDELDLSRLLQPEAEPSFRRNGISHDILRKLRRGHWRVQAELDLHGLRSDQARAALAGFIAESQALGLRYLRVVHGKGLSTPDREPVLPRKVQVWLVQIDAVLAFCQARPADGGSGALLLLLRGAAAAAGA